LHSPKLPLLLGSCVVSYFGVGCSLESEERLRESSKGKRKKVEGEDRKKI
jgi:hypothetical protein